MNMDLYLFNLVNSFAGQWSWLDFVGIFFAKYLEYFLWLFLFFFLMANLKKYWKMVLEALIAAVFTRLILTEGIRWLWFRPRPFVSLDFIPLIGKSASEASFPSGHASFYFALSTIVYCYNKKAGILFYATTFLIVTSRIFVGVHWPSDILAGAVIGILMGWILNKIFREHGNKIIESYNN